MLLRCKAMKSFEIAVARVAQIYNIIYGRIQSENCFLITIPFPETYFQAVKYNDNDNDNKCNKCNVSCMS